MSSPQLSRALHCMVDVDLPLLSGQYMRPTDDSQIQIQEDAVYPLI